MYARTFTLLLLITCLASAGVSFENLPAHPRLFANKERFASLKEEVAVDGRAKDFHHVIKTRAEQLLKQPPASRVMTGKRLLGVSRRALECITFSAMAGKLEDHAGYKQRAVTEMRALAAFSDWNPSHFLDVAEATLAMAVGYDWLYDDLLPEDRELIATAIITKGLKASLPNAGGRPMWWITVDNNWNQVCHAGMTIGALAIAERDPALAASIIDRAVANLHHAAKTYAPDGVYPEGPGYWIYGTGFHVAMIEALRTSLGNTYGLEQFPGFLKTADFITQMEAPSGRFYNFSDNSQTRGFTTPLFWFARELKRPDLIHTDLAILRKIKEEPRRLDRLLPLALIWWDPAGLKEAVKLPNFWSGEGKVPLSVARQNWSDPDATFVAFKGGSPGISHAHMDVGSFILERDRIRWAEDLGAQSYNDLESRGINLWDSRQGSQRWQVFRLGPEAHNIPRFNGAPQNVKGSSAVVKADPSTRTMVLNLTSLYQPNVTSARRGVRMMPDSSVIIRDEWHAANKPVSMSFQWLTKAKVSVKESGALLQVGDKSLQVLVASKTGVSIKVEDISSPVNDYDQPNPGLSRITFTTNTQKGEPGSMEVTVVAKDGKVPAVGALDTW